MGARAGAMLALAWMVGCVAHDADAVAAGAAPTPAFTPEILVSSGGERAGAPMSLTAADGTGLRLQGLTAQVVLEPPLAFTQLELEFQNPQPRRLEGRFEIALPPGAAISRLALQIGSSYQEGEVVERRRAHVAYEEALHQRRDPALLERDGGNQYRVRVFPIEARETKRVIVAYSQRIDGNDEPYRLHLQGLPKVARLGVEVEHLGTGGEPERLRFDREGWQPEGDLLVPIAAPPTHGALRHGDLALLHVTPLQRTEPSPLERLTVLLDTSASSVEILDTQLERLRELTAAVAQRQGAPFPVQLVVFDQESVPLLQTRSDRLGDEVGELIEARGALGATDLQGALRTLLELPELGDRLWVLSDGIATAGATEPPALQQAAQALSARGVQRLDVISPAGVLERRLLEALASAGLPEGGVVITDDAPADATRRLLTRTAEGMRVQVPGAAWTYPERLTGLEPGKRYPVFAQLRAELPLRLRLGEQEMAVAAAPSRTGALLEREWARAKLAYLQQKLERSDGADVARIRDKIVEISQHQRVLTDHTALVVLETERDYARHRIARTDLGRILRVEDGQLVALNERQPVEDSLFHEPWLREPAAGERAVTLEGGDIPAGRREASPRPAPSIDERAAATPPTPSGAGELFGGAIALGSDPNSARGALSGHGFGGLGMGGTGRGGALSTEGTIGLGNIGTIGHGRDRSAGGFRGRRATAPRVRMGKADVRGSLSKEVVRRIVRRHINEVRFCYEQQAETRPQLEGRVGIKFIVNPTGGVQTAAVASSTLGNARVEQCIAKAVRRWSFPAPEGGGIVVVTYPFVLQQVGGAPFVALPRQEQQRRAEDEAARKAERKRKERLRVARLRRERLRQWRSRPKPRPGEHLEGTLRHITERITAGDATPALADARRWRASAPADPLALLALAKAAEAAGEPELAARAHGSLIDLFPSRADMRRAAGQRLESLGEPGVALAVDSYRKAVELRPDHPSSHRLLAFGLLRQGDRDAALDALRRGQTASYPRERFPRVERILHSDALLLQGAPPFAAPSARICLYWETDATNMNLHVYDGHRRHVHSQRPRSMGGGLLESNMRSGFGPECFTDHDDARHYPYTVQAHLTSRGPMGHTMASVHILQRDRSGELHTEVRPFIVMKDNTYVDLGTVKRPVVKLASAER